MIGEPPRAGEPALAHLQMPAVKTRCCLANTGSATLKTAGMDAAGGTDPGGIPANPCDLSAVSGAGFRTPAASPHQV